MKSRSLALALAVLLSVFSARAEQPKFQLKSATRLLLEQKIVELQSRLDSMQTVVDSLNAALPAEIPSEAEDLDEPEQAREYSREITDSLIDVWYNSNRNTDFETVGRYDMDVEHFTSNVSDEVMIERLSAMNAYFTLPFNETVKNYMILYSEKMPSRMKRVLGLSKFYFPIFEETLSRYGLPLELKYLPIIESMLNPTATSRAGARGMWQFMYNTARAYGLEINSWVDERLDVEKATDAAARYMADAYRVFGDWSLAISSYNCGAGNVQKAISRAGGKSDFWSIYPYLPRETRGYVPAFVGAMYAMTYWREYGLEPEDVGMPAQIDTFEVHRKLHFRQVEEIVGVSVEQMRQLNPEYLHDVVPGTAQHAFVINLPYRSSSTFLAVQDTLYLHLADSLLSADVLKDIENKAAKSGSTGSGRIAYKVKSGDYLGRIASRYNVSVKQIKNWNHLRSDNIRAGQVLYIYK